MVALLPGALLWRLFLARGVPLSIAGPVRGGHHSKVEAGRSQRSSGGIVLAWVLSGSELSHPRSSLLGSVMGKTGRSKGGSGMVSGP